MVDTLIENGHVITVDRERRSIPDASIAIDDGRIVAVGPTAELAKTYRPGARRRIDARRKVVLPGLIDAHAHAGHGLMKTIGGGDGEKWAQACAKVYALHSPPSFWEAEARLAALERLKCGTTTGLSMLGGGDGTMRTDRPDYALAHAAATKSVGIRSIVAVGLSNPPFPKTFRDHINDADEVIDVEDQLASCSALIDAFSGGDDWRIRICLMMSVLKPDAVGDGGIDRFWYDHADAVRSLSRDAGTLFTQDGHCRGSVALADTLGLLGDDAVFSHCVDLEDAEVERIVETGTRVVTNPSANMAIRGRCPVVELLDAGGIVMIGSDGTAPDRSADMFRHMQQAMHYHRRHFRDTRVLPPGKTLEMVTIDAARGLRLDDHLGSIEVGKRADLIFIDLAKPHLYPLQMPLWRVVSFANGADVDTVMIDGEILMAGRQVVTVDEQDTLDHAQEAAVRAITDAGLLDQLAEPPSLWRGTRF